MRLDFHVLRYSRWKLPVPEGLDSEYQPHSPSIPVTEAYRPQSQQLPHRQPMNAVERAAHARWLEPWRSTSLEWMRAWDFGSNLLSASSFVLPQQLGDVRRRSSRPSVRPAVGSVPDERLITQLQFVGWQVQRLASCSVHGLTFASASAAAWCSKCLANYFNAPTFLWQWSDLQSPRSVHGLFQMRYTENYPFLVINSFGCWRAWELERQRKKGYIPFVKYYFLFVIQSQHVHRYRYNYLYIYLWACLLLSNGNGRNIFKQQLAWLRMSYSFVKDWKFIH